MTEQANRKHDSINTPWNPSELMLEYLVDIKRSAPTGLANKIGTIFEGAFLADFNEREGSFSDF